MTELWYIDHADRDGKTFAGPFLTPDETIAFLRLHQACGGDGLVISMITTTDEDALRQIFQHAESVRRVETTR